MNWRKVFKPKSQIQIMDIFYTYCTEEYSPKRYVVNLHITLNSVLYGINALIVFVSEMSLVCCALKRLELLLAALPATLTPLSCSPNFPRSQYLDIAR